MNGVGDEVLRRITGDLDILEAQIRGTWSFRLTELDLYYYEKTLEIQRSRLEGWRRNWDYYPPHYREELRKYYSAHIAYMNNRFLSVQDLLSRKARMLNWKQHASRFLRTFGLLFRGFSFVAGLFGFWPSPVAGLLSGGSPRAIGYSPHE